MKRVGRTSNKELFRKLKKATNPVTKSVYRDIFIKRIERHEYE